MEIDFFQDMRIDEDALDVEWIEQGTTALKYAKYVSQLRREVNRLAELKKTTRSELITEANRNPISTTFKKSPNASDIEAYYRNSVKYQEAVTHLLDKQEELDFAELAFNEISWTRRKALENLVTLHGQKYFAGPSVPRNLSKEVTGRRKTREEREDIQKSTDERIAGKMRRKQPV